MSRRRPLAALLLLWRPAQLWAAGLARFASYSATAMILVFLDLKLRAAGTLV